MIDGLRPYPEMKPTGLPWLGAVPAHWDVRRAKRMLKPTEIPVRPEDDIVTCFRDGQVTLRKNRRSSGFMIALLEQGYQGVRVGQLVVHSMDAFAGAIGISDSDGKCTPEYIVCDPREPGTLLSYYAWLLRYVARTQYILAAHPAVRERAPRLRYPDLGELKLPVPPLDEQRQIVRFLDWHGARTATLIRAKKKLIALLNEQKQAIIHRAVTRGLDPTCKLKPSGIPWLGDVPEGWEVRKLKQIARLRSGEGITAFQIEESGLFPVYGGNGLRGYTSRHTHEGDFILIGRQGALCGNINYASGQFFASEHAMVVHPRSRFAVRWLGELLRVMNLNQYSIAAAQPGLSVERIEILQLPVPPFDEQEVIVCAVDEQTAELNEAISVIGSEIALIQEFRTRLIADVVTGKLDVRTLAPSLPKIADLESIDEPTDGEDLDEAIMELDNEEVAA